MSERVCDKVFFLSCEALYFSVSLVDYWCVLKILLKGEFVGGWFGLYKLLADEIIENNIYKGVEGRGIRSGNPDVIIP